MIYSQILSRRFSGRQWSLSSNDLATLIIHDGGANITQAELDPLWPSVEAEIIAEKDELSKAKEVMSGLSQWVVMEILLEVVGKAIKQGKIGSTPRADILIAKWDEINGN